MSESAQFARFDRRKKDLCQTVYKYSYCVFQGGNMKSPFKPHDQISATAAEL